MKNIRRLLRLHEMLFNILANISKINFFYIISRYSSAAYAVQNLKCQVIHSSIRLSNFGHKYFEENMFSIIFLIRTSQR